MPSTGVTADPAVQQHDAGTGHPEQPARYTAIVNSLESAGLLREMVRLEPRTASDDELALAHSRRYIDLVSREIAEGRSMLSTGDTAVGEHSLEAARAAAGSTLNAVDAVFNGTVQNAFCLVRPPGHHASSDRGMGFCFFNNVAVATRYAQHRYGAERALIVDWDVHHGNGTQDIFYCDGSVLFFSTHQSPWYPGTGSTSETGEGEGASRTINCPLPAGTGSGKLMQAFREVLVPAAREFRPDLILVSAGFDSRVGDPLGQFLLTDSDFHELTSLLLDLSITHCNGRLISVLEGGYNLVGLAMAAEAHTRALLGKA